MSQERKAKLFQNGGSQAVRLPPHAGRLVGWAIPGELNEETCCVATTMCKLTDRGQFRRQVENPPRPYCNPQRRCRPHQITPLIMRLASAKPSRLISGKSPWLQSTISGKNGKEFPPSSISRTWDKRLVLSTSGSSSASSVQTAWAYVTTMNAPRKQLTKMTRSSRMYSLEELQAPHYVGSRPQ